MTAILGDVGLIVRYCAVERPYWAAFLNHYALLGVTSIDVCVQSSAERDDVLSLPTPSGLKARVHLQPADCEPNQALRRLDLVQAAKDSKWLMLVDCDEYFVASAGARRPEELASAAPGVTGFDVPWVMNPLVCAREVPSQGYFGRGIKHLARARDVSGVLTAHRFAMIDSRAGPLTRVDGHLFGLWMVHYWARSFRDCLLRLFFSRLIDFKTSDQGIALAKIRSGDLPNRLKLLAFLELQPRNLAIPMPSTDLFDLDAEEAMLRTYVTAKDEADAWDSYLGYKDRLARDRPELFYPHPTMNLIQLGSLLP